MNDPRHFTILSIDGGGMRGVFATEVISRIHQKYNLLQRVNLLAGTSTGGVIAGALAAGLSPERVSELYCRLGRMVFCGMSPLLRSFNPFCSRYSSTILRRVLSSTAIESKTLGDLRLSNLTRRCLFTAVTYGTHQCRVFDSADPEDRSLRLVDVMLASAAAPYYFRPHRIDKVWYIDGGVGCNNPSLIAANRAQSSGRSASGIRILSVGTCAAIGGQAPPDSRIRARHLFGVDAIRVCMDATANSVDEQCKMAFREAYCRLDGVAQIGEIISLDDYGGATSRLPGIAAAVFATESERIGRWFDDSHVP